MKEFIKNVANRVIIRERNMIVHEKDLQDVLSVLDVRLRVEKLDPDVECREWYLVFYTTDNHWETLIKNLDDTGFEIKLAYPNDYIVLKKV